MSQADDNDAGMGRRSFLQLAGGGLLGVAGCSISEPDDVIVPYADLPPEAAPGVPLHYATSSVLGGYATGLIAATYGGRPVKLEGNPRHPASLGKSGVFEQALLFDLYDPTRARDVRSPAGQVGKRELLRYVVAQRNAWRSGKGAVLLLEPTSSPTIIRLVQRLRERHPELTIAFFEPLAPLERWQALRLCFGAVLDPILDLAAADVVLTLDHDLFGSGPGHLRYAHDVAQRRRSGAEHRLFAVEAQVSPTGILADQRLAVRRRDVGTLAALVFAEVAASAMPREPAALSIIDSAARLEPLTPHGAWARSVARQLLGARGRALVTAGDAQPAWVHGMVLATNALLGSLAQSFVPSSLFEAGEGSHDPTRFVARLEGGVDFLAVLGGDPLRTLPADLGAAPAFAAAKERLAFGDRYDRTAAACQWHIPAAHALESWSDARAYDGTLSLAQPLVRPLWRGTSLVELLAMFLADETPARDLVRGSVTPPRAEAQVAARLFEAQLAQGFVEDSAPKRVTPKLDWKSLRPMLLEALAKAHFDDRLELCLNPDPRLHDGRFVENQWLLELPAPATQLTWDNAALVAPATADKLGLEDGDVVAVSTPAASVELPVLRLPGAAEGSLGITLGWGQRPEVGADVYPLRTTLARWAASGVQVQKTGAEVTLAVAQAQATMAGRDVVRELPRGGAFAKEAPRPSFHQRRPGAASQWGMSIDLASCMGCAACAIACQAENNIPVVGKSGVLKSRQMHWLRIDRYVVGEGDTARHVVMPMLCQHCEKAPCEYVCPTAATTHSDDGLNEMVYNRCVGTRFCSNNCPYKVRRFNWFDYHQGTVGPLELLMNPDVTVRARGVMEKCTFCVQRIRRAGIDARLAGQPRPPTDSFTTACAQACPTSAIVFGDLADQASQVHRLQDSPRAYDVLGELNTAPRVRYLARLPPLEPEVQK